MRFESAASHKYFAISYYFLNLKEKMIQIDYKKVFEEAPTAKVILSPDNPRFTILAANRAYYELTHTDRSILGRSLFEVFPDNSEIGQPGSRTVYLLMMEALLTKKVVKSTITRYDIMGKDGKMYPRYWTSENVPILNEDGEVDYILQGALDVTHLVEMGLKI